MAVTSTEMEIQTVVHWFQSWSIMQKGDFLRDLVDKAVPTNVDTLFDSMHTLNVRDKPPSIFQCQLRLFTQWFELWTDKERNELMLKLQMIDPEFMAKFDEEVKSTTQSQIGNISDDG